MATAGAVDDTDDTADDLDDELIDQDPSTVGEHDPIAEDDELFGLTDDDVDAEDDTDDEADDAVDIGAVDADDPFAALDDDAKGNAGKPPAAVAQPRDLAGKYAAKTAADAATAATTAAADAATAKTAADAIAAATPPAPKWEKLTIRSDKGDVAMDEALVTRTKDANGQGYHLVTVKDEDYARFAERLNRSHLFERNRQEIVGYKETLAKTIKELEAEAANPAKSDAQIEAEMMLDVLKPMLEEMDPRDIDILELRIQKAQRDHKDGNITARATYEKTAREAAEAATAAAAKPAEEEATQLRGLVNELLTLADARPELAGMTDEQKRAAFTDLTPIMRSAYYRDAASGEWMVNRGLIYKALTSRFVPAVVAPAPVASTNTATSAAALTKGDRFNRAQDTAATPKKTSTSLAAGRTAGPRSARNTSTAAPAKGRGPVKTAAMLAEDKMRASHKKFMASDTLDFEDDGEDDA